MLIRRKSCLCFVSVTILTEAFVVEVIEYLLLALESVARCVPFIL